MTELEWPVKGLLEEWAEVASFDAPGAGSEPAPQEYGPGAVVARGLEEIDRRNWDRCVVVGDEFGGAHAVQLAGARPEAVEGLVLGHPCLSLETQGARAPLNAEVYDAFRQMSRGDYRTYSRALTQLTRGAYDDEQADRYRERVPQEVDSAYGDAVQSSSIGSLLTKLDVPMLLVEHKDCLLWTKESFEDAVAALPKASTGRVDVKPSSSPDFAELLRSFCTSLAPTRA